MHRQQGLDRFTFAKDGSKEFGHGSNGIVQFEGRRNIGNMLSAPCKELNTLQRERMKTMKKNGRRKKINEKVV